MSNGQFKTRKTLAVTITLILVLFLSTFLTVTFADKSWTGNTAIGTFVPNSASVPPWDGVAYCYTRPPVIGVGQYLLIEAWISPRPRYNSDIYYNYKFTFTSPSGHTSTTVIPYSEHPGSIYFEKIVDEVGEWTVRFDWAGDDAPSWTNPPPGWTAAMWEADSDDWIQDPARNYPADSWISGEHNLVSTTETFVVQQDPIPNWPEAQLPTDGWTWPVNPENRDWYKIMGDWPTGKYNSTYTCANPFSEPVKSPHVLWRLAPYSGVGGMAGGWYGSGTYLPASTPSITTVMIGRAYASYGGQIHCFDAHTGEELWAVAGSFVTGRIRYSGGNAYPELINNALFGTFQKFDGVSGALIHESTHPVFAGGFFGSSIFVDPYFYSLQTLGNITYLVKWDTTSNSANFSSRVVWNATFYDRNTGEGIKITEYSWNRGGANVMNVGDYSTIAFVTYPIYGESGAFDTTTGQLLWHRNIEDFESRLSIGAGYGYFYMTEWPDHWNAWNFRTGERVWTGQEATYPWGDFWAYQMAVANGLTYGVNYDGHVYAYDALGTYTGTPGAFAWNYSVGSKEPYSMETPYPSWPIYSGPLLSGDSNYGYGETGLYAATSEWGTPSPYYRGQKMFAINAVTGEEYWQLGGSWNPAAVAEGVLFAQNRYDGYAYAIGRGPTQTEVSTGTMNIAKGDSVWVMGRVTDQTPILKDTPAVSKDSMQAWMEYKFFQQPRPMTTVGVDVTLYASANGGIPQNIGTVTCDGEGYFSLKWTPSDENLYQITASFNGDESYYSSYNTTFVSVGPEVTEPVQPNGNDGTATPDYTNMLYGILAGVVIAIVILIIAVYTIRKQKK